MLFRSDLNTYRSAVEALPERALLCGFVCGWPELVQWEKSDLLSLLLDTKPICGNLSGLLETIGEEDFRRAAAGLEQIAHRRINSCKASAFRIY